MEMERSIRPCHPEMSTGRELEEKVQARDRVMVQFVAKWCGTCHIVEPVVDELAQDYCGKLSVFRIDLGKYPEVGERFGIYDTPTFLFFHGGHVIDHAIGALPRNKMEAKMRGLAEA